MALTWADMVNDPGFGPIKAAPAGELAKAIVHGRLCCVAKYATLEFAIEYCS